MPVHRTRQLWLSLLALLATLVVFAAQQQGLFEPLEFRSLDWRFVLRHQLGYSPRVERPIVLVVFDEKALETLPEPFSLWRPRITQGIRAVLEKGASVVAPDVQFELEVGDLPPAYAQIASEHQASDRELLALVLDHPVVVGCQLDADGTLHLPLKRLVAAAFNRLALLNSQEASDGAVRYLPSRRGVQMSGATYEIPYLAAATAHQAGAEELPLTYWINYAGPTGTIPRISLADVLAGKFELPPQAIVFIGSWDRRLGDYHRSPFSHFGEADMAGVEVQAQAARTLLARDWLQPWSGLPTFLAIALLAGVAPWTAWRMHPARAALAGVVVVLIWWTVVFLLFLRGQIAPAVAPTLALLLSGLMAYGLRTLTIERERQAVTEVFGRMVSRQVLEALLEDPHQLGRPTNREITVLFADINNFTPTCEQYPPGQVLGMLTDYFETLTVIVQAHGGTIKQFVGDEIMVMFGAPQLQFDHADRAVQTALAIRRALREKEETSQGKPGFYDVKIGLNTGPVVLGRVGARSRWEYAAVGDPVNAAARVMGLTKQIDDNLLVSETTREACDGDYGWKDLGEHSMKGKQSTLRIFGLDD
ncbi:MAG: adenylate/guanylate cyclase domain-containing protein [Vulcanimicrobiota bacterium]